MSGLRINGGEPLPQDRTSNNSTQTTKNTEGSVWITEAPAAPEPVSPMDAPEPDESQNNDGSSDVRLSDEQLKQNAKEFFKNKKAMNGWTLSMESITVNKDGTVTLNTKSSKIVDYYGQNKPEEWSLMEAITLKYSSDGVLLTSTTVYSDHIDPNKGVSIAGETKTVTYNSDGTEATTIQAGHGFRIESEFKYDENKRAIHEQKTVSTNVASFDDGVFNPKNMKKRTTTYEIDYTYDENGRLKYEEAQETQESSDNKKSQKPEYYKKYYEYDNQGRVVAKVTIKPVGRQYSDGSMRYLPYVIRQEFDENGNSVRITRNGLYRNSYVDGLKEKNKPYYEEICDFMKNNGYKFAGKQRKFGV